jgi:hypothetical protein
VPEVTLSRNSAGVLSLSFPAAANIQYNVELSSDNKEFFPFEVMGQASTGTISRSLNRTNDVTFVRVTPL